MERCVNCDKEIVDNEFIKIYGNNYVCKNCSNELDECHYCGELTNILSEIYNDDEDYYYDVCPLCYKEKSLIYPHDYKPIINFSKPNDRKYVLHVGAELEIQGYEYECFINKMDNEIIEKDFYLKSDGSLNDDGVEIVSHPMILPIMLKKWKQVFDLMKLHKMNDTNGCGLHFHLDRKYLNDRQIKNIDYIINNFTKSVEKIGSRNILTNEWSERVNKNINEWGVYAPWTRYVAVNLRNKNTVELRCFNSTDDWNKFKSIVIFVFALVEYAKIHTFEYFTKTNDDKFYISLHRFINNFKKHNYID